MVWAKRYRGLVGGAATHSFLPTPSPPGTPGSIPHPFSVFGDGVRSPMIPCPVLRVRKASAYHSSRGSWEVVRQGGLCLSSSTGQGGAQGRGDSTFADIGVGVLAVGLPARHVLFTVLENIFKTGGHKHEISDTRPWIMLPLISRGTHARVPVSEGEDGRRRRGDFLWS